MGNIRVPIVVRCTAPTRTIFEYKNRRPTLDGVARAERVGLCVTKDGGKAYLRLGSELLSWNDQNVVFIERLADSVRGLGIECLA